MPTISKHSNLPHMRNRFLNNTRKQRIRSKLPPVIPHNKLLSQLLLLLAMPSSKATSRLRMLKLLLSMLSNQLLKVHTLKLLNRCTRRAHHTLNRSFLFSRCNQFFSLVSTHNSSNSSHSNKMHILALSDTVWCLVKSHWLLFTRYDHPTNCSACSTASPSNSAAAATARHPATHLARAEAPGTGPTRGTAAHDRPAAATAPATAAVRPASVTAICERHGCSSYTSSRHCHTR